MNRIKKFRFFYKFYRLYDNPISIAFAKTILMLNGYKVLIEHKEK